MLHTRRMTTGVAKGRRLGPARLTCVGMLAALLVSACGGSDTQSPTALPSGSATSTAHAERSAPASALTVRVSDPDCPDKQGVGVNTAEWTSRAARRGNDFPGLAAAMLANGDTLVVASGAPRPDTAVAAEFRTSCEMNTAFGQGGATLLANAGHGVSITDVLPTTDGGALIAGGTNSLLDRHWLVGKLTADGQLDQAFGNQGWASLPWRYTATAMAVTHSGDIVVGGLGSQNGSSFVTEIDANGRLVPTFGVGGRTRMPPWHDGGVSGVWIEPNGNILALVGGGNMGCWGVVAVTLTPSGQRALGFTSRFRQELRQADPNPKFGLPIFIGNAVVSQDGFHLVGTAQNDCVDNPPRRKPNPTQRVTDIAFGYDGRLDPAFGTNGVTSFSAPIASEAWALPQADGSVLLVTSPDHNGFFNGKKRADMRLYRIGATGHLDISYASHGVADVPLPFTVGNYTIGPPAAVSNGHQTVIVTSTASGNAVILVRTPTG